MSGPLSGVKVVELAGAGPGPQCAMMLADLGATVIRIDRPAIAGKEVGVAKPLKFALELRNRYTISLDLKDPRAIEILLELIDSADALIEVSRPGVAERLGIGPDVCLERNPRLVYGRMTGWGQTGPLAPRVGHDLNYIGLTGVLDGTGRKGQPPTPPLMMVGDYGGGATYLAFGILAGLLEASRSGKGQVVDAAIVDGVASLASSIYGFRQSGMWNLERGENIADSGAAYYDVYETSDGRYMAFAPFEERFYRTAVTVLGLDPDALPSRDDPANWDELKGIIGGVFRTDTREAWTAKFIDEDACVTPVLNWDEAHSDPHLSARGTFIDLDGAVAPAPAPRFSRTEADFPRPAMIADSGSIQEALHGWLSPERITEHVAAGYLITG